MSKTDKYFIFLDAHLVVIWIIGAGVLMVKNDFWWGLVFSVVPTLLLKNFVERCVRNYFLHLAVLAAKDFPTETEN